MEAADKETSGSNLEQETTSLDQGDNEGVNQELGITVTTETMSSSHQHQEDDTGKNQKTAGSSSSEQVPQESVKEGNPGLSITETGCSSDDNEYALLLKLAIDEKIREWVNCEAIKERHKEDLRRTKRKRDNQVRKFGNLIKSFQNHVNRATKKAYLLKKKIYDLENERDELLKKTANAIDQQITRDAAGVNMMEDDLSEASGMNNNLAGSDFFHKFDGHINDSDIY